MQVRRISNDSIAIIMFITLSSRTAQSFQEPCVTQSVPRVTNAHNVLDVLKKKRVSRVHHRRPIQETGRRSTTLIYTIALRPV